MVEKVRSEKAVDGVAELFLVDASTDECQLFRVGVVIPLEAPDEKTFESIEDAVDEYDKLLENFHEIFDGKTFGFSLKYEFKSKL